MQSKHVGWIAALLAASWIGPAAAGEGSKVVAADDLAWEDTHIPGVVAATVSGDMGHGASRFFLRYPAGLVTPRHHHTARHHVTLVSGRLTLSVDGVDHALAPGSWFELAPGAPHVAKVEGGEPALMYVEAEDAWDVVPES